MPGKQGRSRLHCPALTLPPCTCRQPKPLNSHLLALQQHCSLRRSGVRHPALPLRPCACPKTQTLTFSLSSSMVPWDAAGSAAPPCPAAGGASSSSPSSSSSMPSICDHFVHRGSTAADESGPRIRPFADMSPCPLDAALPLALLRPRLTPLLTQIPIIQNPDSGCRSLIPSPAPCSHGPSSPPAP